MNSASPDIPLDLARRVFDTYYYNDLDTTPEEDMQAALTAHLPDLAKLPAVRDLVLADRREADVEVIAKALHDDSVCDKGWPCSKANAERYRDRAKRIAAALSDASNGGHWEKGDEAFFRAWKAGLPHRVEYRGPASGTTISYGWVPANPDAALLTIVDADTLARLREVAEVTLRNESSLETR